jgi:hypothetical protein
MGDQSQACRRARMKGSLRAGGQAQLVRSQRGFPSPCQSVPRRRSSSTDSLRSPQRTARRTCGSLPARHEGHHIGLTDRLVSPDALRLVGIGAIQGAGVFGWKEPVALGTSHGSQDPPVEPLSVLPSHLPHGANHPGRIARAGSWFAATSRRLDRRMAGMMSNCCCARDKLPQSHANRANIRIGIRR